MNSTLTLSLTRFQVIDKYQPLGFFLKKSIEGGKDMYGWRARIGKVEPSRGDTYQYEFYQIAPKGVVLVVSIIGLFNLVKDELSAAYLKYKAAARDLAEVGVDVIALGGSPVFQL